MNVRIICPAPRGSLSGNRATALRWAGILRELGHSVTIAQEYGGRGCDLVVAMHARRSADAVLASREPVILALTGTDLYVDLRTRAGRARALSAIEKAAGLVVLQPRAIDELAPHLRSKARVIFQSAEKTTPRPPRTATAFRVAVSGHLRAIKDPLRAACASRRLAASSRIEVVHLGAAMDAGLAEKARAEERRNPRYRWLGGLPARKARRIVASSHLLVVSSRMEGGANVISEALVDRVPVIASDVAGNAGLLGGDYPGLFEAGDTAALAALLERAETDRAFYGLLKTRCSKLAPLFSRARERAAWRALLAELIRSFWRAR
jgi:putative glycosyltransferase (TIGR04348 family)